MIARTSCLRFVSAECSVLLWLAWLWLTGAANVLAQGNLRRLYGELSERQGGAFRASLRTVPMTRGVNVALGPPSAWLGGDDGESEADAEDGAAGTGVAAAAGAAAAEAGGREPPAVPGAHVISRTDCVQGRFRSLTSSNGL